MQSLLFIVSLLLCQSLWAAPAPKAEHGFLDLAGWSSDAPLRLDGEWRFFPGQLLDPLPAWQNLQNADSEAKFLRPGERWTDIRSGTYLLRMKAESLPNKFWLTDLRVYTSARVFAFEGKPGESLAPLQELGRVAPDRDSQKVFSGRSRPISFERQTQDDVFVLIQVADFHHYWSGLWMAPMISSQSEDFSANQAYFFCVLAGILLFAFAQNVSLFIGHRNYQAGRDLTIVVGLMALRAALQAVYAVLANVDLEWMQKTYEWQLDLLYMCLILSSAYFYSFVQACFPSKIHLPEKQLYMTALILCLGLTVLPWSHSEAWLLAVDAYIFFTGYASTLTVFRAVQNRQDEAVISMVGIGALFLGGISALAWALGDFDQAQYGTELGLAIFVYCETQVVSRRFVRTLQHLEEVTRSLDAKDQVRTQILQATSHELRTPLNGMIGFLDLIQREQFGSLPDTVHFQLSRTQKLAESLKGQVDTILRLADIKSTELQARPNNLELLQLNDVKPTRVHRARTYSQTFHVLVIDDDTDNAELMAEILSMDALRVSIAAGGKAGIEQVEALHPDLVILDLTMPDVSGEDVLRHLKSVTSIRDIPVILYSARGTEEERLTGLQLGADDYLVKPIVMDELRLRVRNLLDRMELHRTLADHEYKDKMSQLGELLADLSHEMKNIYQSVDNAELNPNERLQYVVNLLPLPEAQRQILAKQLPQRIMDSEFHDRENWLSAPDRQHPCYRDLRYLRFTIALLPVQEGEARELWRLILALPQADLTTLSQCLHLLSNHLQLVDVALRSRELIEAILGFNRQESESQTLNLAVIAQRTVNLVQMRLRKSSIELECQLEEIEAQGSGSAVQQILLNVLSNAIDSLNAPSVETRWIRIEIKAVNGQPTIKLSNSGPEIAAEHRSRLFERGFTTKGQRGSGIGLYVSRRLARRMNGDLLLATDQPNTCFVLELAPARATQLLKAS